MTISKKIGKFCKTNDYGKLAVSSFCTCFWLGRNSWPELSPCLGSLAGIIIYLLTGYFSVPLQICLLIVLSVAVVFSADIYEQIEGKKNPASIIIDEAIGMWVSLFLIKGAGFKVVLSAFLIFRFLDFFKLFPINMFQSFKNGKGILADDFAAGMITNFIIRLLLIRGVL